VGMMQWPSNKGRPTRRKSTGYRNLIESINHPTASGAEGDATLAIPCLGLRAVPGTWVHAGSERGHKVEPPQSCI
jgi:hypothetical protein